MKKMFLGILLFGLILDAKFINGESPKILDSSQVKPRRESKAPNAPGSSIVSMTPAADRGNEGAVNFEAAIGAESERLLTLKIALDQFSEHKTIELKTISTSFPVKFPIPDRWSVKSARLILRYTNSVTLIPERSQLTVALNNHPIGQIRPIPSRPDGIMSLNVPIGFLETGYNSLNFSVAQHYQDSCEQWDSPNLWTSLDLTSSFIELTYVEKYVPMSLGAAAGFMFDSKMFPHGAVNIVLDIGSTDLFTAAGIAASGIAHRFDYRKVFFTASNNIEPGQDNILIGHKSDIETMAKKFGIELNVSGPTLKIAPLPLGNDESGRSIFDQTHGLLIVTGSGPQEILRAAMSISGLTIPFPGSDVSAIKEFTPPIIEAYSGNKYIEGGKEYPLKDLGYRTYTFRKMNPLATEFIFRLPNDYQIAPNKYAALKLNYSYGPGMKNSSSLSVSVNETVARTIQLDNIKGDFISGYHLDLPTYLFEPGINRIAITSYLNPDGIACEMFMPDSYFMTLHDNSTLEFPSMEHFVHMPDIGFFADSGFPFTRWSDGRDLEIFITQPEYEVLSAALNIAGFVSQKGQYPLFGSKISVGSPINSPSASRGDGKEIIVIGSAGSIPEPLMLSAPIRIGKETASLSPIYRTWGDKTLFATARQISGIDPKAGMLMEYESPIKRGRTLLLFTAPSSAELLKLTHLLLSPGANSKMKGTAVFVDLRADSENSVTALDTGKSYWTGKFGRISTLRYFLSVYPYSNYLLAVFLMLAASLGMYQILARIRKRRLALAADKNFSY